MSIASSGLFRLDIAQGEEEVLTAGNGNHEIGRKAG